MNCPDCGHELLHRHDASGYPIGHPTVECLRNQLAAMTAQRDQAWAACRAVLQYTAHGPNLVNPISVLTACRAVVAEADTYKKETQP